MDKAFITSQKQSVLPRKKVIMQCLPPHTTHDAQWLDCSVFLPLKTRWRAVWLALLQSNPEKVVTKFNFNSLFSQAWLQSVTPANVIARFKTCGMYPLNRSPIKVTSTNSTEPFSAGDDLVKIVLQLSSSSCMKVLVRGLTCTPLT